MNKENKIRLKITVWIDPIDGTAEFVDRHLHHVTILIGIAVDGKGLIPLHIEAELLWKSANKDAHYKNNPRIFA